MGEIDNRWIVEDLKEQIKQLKAERDALKSALEKINGLTMSMFAKHSDLSNACLNISGEALAKVSK